MEKNHSLGIFQLGKYIEFMAKVSEIIFLNLIVKYEYKWEWLFALNLLIFSEKKIC